MARPNDPERLHAAWRALAGETRKIGWRAIPLDVPARYAVLVGRRFPGGDEAVLVGFQRSTYRDDVPLPSSRGFAVERPEDGALDPMQDWFALSRRSGSVAMFAAMAADVIGLLETSGEPDDERLLQLFLGRIRAWQEFMEKERDGVLGPEAEMGLFGELLVLLDLLDVGVPTGTALDWWRGPSDALHDYQVGSGAIEVKTTIAAVGFPAMIGSLEQLDGSMRQPLFVSAVRLAAAESGDRLPDLVARARLRVQAQLGHVGVLDSRLIQAGYLHVFADRYTRRFGLRGTKYLLVDDEFPKLTRAGVPRSIIKAQYVVDIDDARRGDYGLTNALKLLGVR
jgi:hypothetical protein